MTLYFDFRGQLQTFRAINAFKSWSFKSKNDLQKTVEQSQNNIKKAKKRIFLALKNFKIGQNDNVTETNISTKNIDFDDHKICLEPILKS